MSIELRHILGQTDIDITLVTTDFCRILAELCGLEKRDLLIASVPSFNTLGPKRSHWTLQDAAAQGDMVVAHGTVTPKDLQWQELHEDGKNPEGAGFAWTYFDD